MRKTPPLIGFIDLTLRSEYRNIKNLYLVLLSFTQIKFGVKLFTRTQSEFGVLDFKKKKQD